MPIVIKSARKPGYVDAPVPEAALRREHALASRHQPRFSRAFLNLVRNLIGESTKRDLKQALQEMVAGRMTVEQVVNVVPWYNPADPIAVKLWDMLSISLRAAYAEVVEDAGDSEMLSHGFPIRFTVEKSRFDDIRVPLNPYSVRWVNTQAAKLVVEISEQQRRLLRKLVAAGFEAGERPIDILDRISDIVGLTEREWRWVENRDKDMAATGMPDKARRAAVAAYRDKLLKDRAKRIARTETVNAYTQGLQDSWQMAKDEGMIPQEAMKEWMEITASPRTCKICQGLGDQRVPIDQPFVSEFIGEIERPPAHPHCLPGDSRVLAQGVSATSQRSYQGDLIVIRTAFGNKIACTPNHPILAHDGWVAAHQLHPGDHVISSSRPDWITPGVVDDQHDRPPVVQKISDFALVEDLSFARRVPVSAQDFHGDGEGSEVAVIRSYGDLRDKVLASVLQKTRELFFELRDMESLCLDCLSALCLGRFRNLATAHGVMGGGSEPLALLGGGASHAHKHRIAAVARLDPGIQKSTSDGRSADSEGFAERLLAHSGVVFPDKIINVDVQSFHGPVFNLETSTGAYIAGGVVTHNCRCTMTLVIPDDPDSAIDQADKDAQAARDALAGRLPNAVSTENPQT